VTGSRELFQDFFRFEFQPAQRRAGDLPRLDDETALATAVGRAGASDVVERLEDGLDTQLGSTWPGGAEISFGQWQKLALARGFMRDNPLLLVLDEPTAAWTRKPNTPSSSATHKPPDPHRRPHHPPGLPPLLHRPHGRLIVVLTAPTSSKPAPTNPS